MKARIILEVKRICGEVKGNPTQEELDDFHTKIESFLNFGTLRESLTDAGMVLTRYKVED